MTTCLACEKTVTHVDADTDMCDTCLDECEKEFVADLERRSVEILTEEPAEYDGRYLGTW